MAENGRKSKFAKDMFTQLILDNDEQIDLISDEMKQDLIDQLYSKNEVNLFYRKENKKKV